jgi:hypothetical protein
MLNLRSPSLAARKTSSNIESEVSPTTDQPCILTVVEGPCDTNLDIQLRFPDPTKTIYSSNEDGEGDMSGM